MAKKELPLKLKIVKRGEASVSVICSHNPTCADSEACIRRSMEYAMGKRATP